MELRTVNVTRYITPLREGGSLPALAEADDGFKYVVKFRGAGHGTKMLVSELIGSVMAQVLGFRVPEIVFINLDEAFGRGEGDEEIQDLLKGSQGLNLGLHYLSGAVTFDPVVTRIDDKTASQIVWMDALLTNVDRTARNANMLMWHKELWLIDHGASLYFHHTWTGWEKYALTPFVQVKDHVLLPWASQLDEVDAESKKILTPEKIAEIVNLLPDDWLHWDGNEESPEAIRKVYISFLNERMKHSEIFINQAKMQGKHLYEYAVIRVVPRVEREEFINVGIIMYAKRQKFLKARYHIDERKLSLFSTELDMESLCANLKAFDKICSAAKDGGFIASLDITERFRWLTAVRSTSIQTSRSNMGFTDDLDATFEKLYEELVM